MVKVYYTATNAGSSPGTTTISARLYSSTWAFNNLGNTNDFYIAYGSDTYTYPSLQWYTSSGQTSVSYYTPANTAEQLLGITSGYVRITGLTSSAISFEFRTDNTIAISYGYTIIYRFFVERLDPTSTSCTASVYDCVYSTSGRYIELWDEGGYTTWSAGSVRSVTVSISTGYAPPIEALSVHMIYSIVQYRYYSATCSVCNSTCTSYYGNGNCASSYCNDCHRYHDWFSWAYSSSNYYYTDTVGFLSSTDMGMLSRQSGMETEMYIRMDGFSLNVGPSSGNYLYVDFTGGSWSGSNLFKWTYTNETVAQVDCKCYVASSISINVNTAYLNPNCYRFLGQGYTTNYGIMIEQDVASGQSLMCYFPGYMGSASTVSAKFRVLNTRTIPAHP